MPLKRRIFTKIKTKHHFKTFDMLRTHFLPLLFSVLLAVIMAHSQDSTKVKAGFKNHFGVMIAPAVIGYFNTKPESTPFYSPAFTTSLYLEYNRIVSKSIWLTGGIGIYSEGYFNSVDLANKVYNEPSNTYYQYKFDC